MSTRFGIRVGEGNDGTRDFVHAVSLIAALETTAGDDGHAETLPYLGMARTELVDFGRRRPTHYLDLEVADFHAGLAELERRLSALLASSAVLQQTLRIEAARGFLRRAAPDGR